MRLGLTSILLLLGAGCGGEGDGPELIGATSFTSAGAGGSFGRDGLPAEDGDEGGADRVVEEADIYRFSGDRLYVLNQFRGLYVLDVSNPDRPVELGRVPFEGLPLEMYVRGDTVYALIGDRWGGWWYGGAEDDGVEAGAMGEEALELALPEPYGTRLLGVDVTDPSAPEVIGEVQLDGTVVDSRLVGDVLYTAANRWSWWSDGANVTDPDGVASTETTSEILVTSIDVSDRTRMVGVDHETIEGSGFFVQATDQAFLIAGSEWDGASGEQSLVHWIDISSPDGTMRPRDTVVVPGSIQEDVALNLHGDQLRVLTREWTTSTTKLHVFDAADPDAITLLGSLDYFYDGSLFGTTFDGDRLYMVHYQRIDPLEIVDLSDPARPEIVGILEMPGWVDRIAPLGERLVGLGVDDTEGTQRTSLSLFDVADPSAPALLDRVTSGPDWSWSMASWERKAWTVDADEGLILFPFSGWSEAERRERHALGIVELGAGTLTPRGEVEALAPVERGALYEERVFAISQTAVQVVDVRDRAHPVATATVELARSVVDYARTSRAGAELVHPGLQYWSWWGGNEPAELRITALDGPDASDPLARSVLPHGADTLLASGDHVVALRLVSGCSWRDCAEAEGPTATVVRLTDPLHPVIVQDLPLPVASPLPEELADGASSWTYWQPRYAAPAGSWFGGTPALDLGGGRWGLLRIETTSCWRLDACRAVGIEPEVGEPGVPVDPTGEPGDAKGSEREGQYVSGYRTETALVVLDLSDPEAPRVEGPVALGEGWLEGAFTYDGSLVWSRSESAGVDDQGRALVRWWMERLQISPDGTIERFDPVNVPGTAIALRDGGDTIVTLDRQWVERAGGPWWGGAGYDLYLNALELLGGQARLTSRLRLGIENGSLVMEGTRAYAVRAELDQSADDSWTVRSSLATVDLSDRDDLAFTADEALGEGWWGVAAVGPRSLALSAGWYGGLALFDRADPDAARFTRFVPTNGWASSVAQDGDTLYLTTGPWGIQTIEMDQR